MRFKAGDVVIKTTGGNKMTVNNIESIIGKYKCYWFVGSSLKESVFSEDEIVTMDDYKRYLRAEEREDKLNKLLNIPFSI